MALTTYRLITVLDFTVYIFIDTQFNAVFDDLKSSAVINKLYIIHLVISTDNVCEFARWTSSNDDCRRKNWAIENVKLSQVTKILSQVSVYARAC